MRPADHKRQRQLNPLRHLLGQAPWCLLCVRILPSGRICTLTETGAVAVTPVSQLIYMPIKRKPTTRFLDLQFGVDNEMRLVLSAHASL